MLYTITPNDMKQTETRVMQNTRITGDFLMQCAANYVKQAVAEHLPRGKRLLCVCGTGNNGGDGLAAVRMFLSENAWAECEIWLMHGTLSPDAQRELDRLKSAFSESPRLQLIQLAEGECPSLPENIGCIVDAMFGTGLCRPLQGQAEWLCQCMNSVTGEIPILAVDIPSGLSGKTGEILGCAVHAQMTLTFHRPKNGLYLKDGPDCSGKIQVCDIGLNAREAKPFDNAEGMAVLERSDLKRLLPRRRAGLHKGSCGRTLLWVGSEGMAGAAAVCAEAALRTGAGLVTVACSQEILPTIQMLCPCAMAISLPADQNLAWEKLRSAMEKADALAIGCGIGQSAETLELLKKVLAWLEERSLPAVLDADALNLLAGMEQKTIHSNWILTPHPAEAARLLHTSTGDILKDPRESVQLLCRTFGGSGILKGARSLLCADGKLAVNPYGTPAMAKGGSGDALTGILVALLAGRACGLYAMTDLELLQTACALHGLAGEMAEKEYGERGVLATDLCRFLGLDYSLPKPKMLIPPQEENAVEDTYTLIVEHKAQSKLSPESGVVCPFNYGYVQQLLEKENRWQDAVLLGSSAPVEWYDATLFKTVNCGARSLFLLKDENAVSNLQKEELAVTFWKEHFLSETSNNS